MEELTQKIERLKAIIYKLTREKELSEQEKEVIEKIIEYKEYGENTPHF